MTGRITRAVLASALFLGLLAGIPILLATTVGWPWPEGGWTSLRLVSDDAVVNILAVIAWLAWLQIAGCLLVELAGQLLHLQVPALGPRVQIHGSRALVRAMLLAGVAGSAVLPTWTPAPAGATTQSAVTALTSVDATWTHSSDSTRTSTPRPSPTSASTGSRTPQTAQPAAYATVARGDTLWSIAERELGDGMRWRQIHQLNAGQQMTDGTVFTHADAIRPGWRLQLPSTPGVSGAPSTAGHVTVSPGDTLAEIAHTELGDLNEWPTLYDLNRDVIGSDPDLILPGQDLRLPGKAASGQRPDDKPPAQRSDTPKLAPAPSTLLEPRGIPAIEVLTERAQSDDVPDAPAGGVDLWRVALATGGCLSFGLAVLLVANRRRQLEHRRPGRLVRPTPCPLRPLERVIHEQGHLQRNDGTFIDLAFRALAKQCRAARRGLPELGAAVLDDTGLTLQLVGVYLDPPAPWTARDDDSWHLDRATDLPDELRDQPAPYPALVSTGRDPEGRLWFLDLEAHGGADPDLPAGLLRYWLTELACTPWSADIDLLIADPTLEPLAAINPERLKLVTPALASRRITSLRDDANDRYAALLDLRRDGVVADTTGPVIVVGALADLAEPGRRHRDRVVRIATSERRLLERAETRWVLTDWDQEIEPFSLDDATFHDIAQLTADTEDLTDAPAGTRDNAAGDAIAARHGTTAATRETDAWDVTSLLPAPDPAYLRIDDDLDSADLINLAPSMPRTSSVAEPDPDRDLDADLAAWRDPLNPRPKVHVLGPVEVAATTGSREGIRNVGGTVEFIVYLACNERGVTKDRAAEDLGWSGATVQNRARDARRLMGLRPDGADWLPDAAKSESARSRGVPTYQLHQSVLMDAHLVQRLRIRARRRGEAGIDDVEAALALVDGEPFDQLRKGGYGWLLEGERHDLHLAAMIDDLRLILRLRRSA